LDPGSIVQHFNSTDPPGPWYVNASHYIEEDLAQRLADLDASADEIKRLRTLHADSKLERMENRDCMKAYAKQFQTRGSVLLITKNDTYPDLFLYDFGGPTTTQDWICANGACDDNNYNSTKETKEMWSKPSAWNFFGTRVEYCLGEVPQERCRLQLSLPIAIIVVFFNAMKAICMLTMVLKVGENMNAPPIMNLGDTIASFLERPEPHTKLMSLTTLDELRYARNLSHPWDTRPKEVRSKPAFRFGAASRTRWGLTVLLYVTEVQIALEQSR
jgi:hypothetical protein